MSNSIKGFRFNGNTYKYDYTALDNAPNVETDKTLAITNRPADAKAVGDEIASIRNAVGTPLTAETASGMTDINKIYVYTGSETGYTNGNWYYFDTAQNKWVSGGTYNSAVINTDDTLTQAGEAADAKAVGDEITDLKSALNELPYRLLNPEYTQGYFKDRTGGVTGESTWAYTNIMSIDRLPIEYTGLSVVTSNAPILFYNGNDTIVGYETPTIGNGTITSIPSTAVKFSLSLKRVDIDGFKIKYKIFDGGGTPSGDTWSTWIDKHAIMFGDSLVSGQADDSVEGGAYARRLVDHLGLAECSNHGASGKPIAEGTSASTGTVTSVTNISNYSSYDLVIIAGGTNDFKLNVPLGEIATFGSTFDRTTFYGAIQTIIEWIIGKKPQIRLVFWTPLQRNNGGYNTYTENTVGKKLPDYCQAIKDVASRYGIPVIDMFNISGVNLRNLSYYTADGLHLNGNGYDLVSYIAAKQINIL